MREYKEKQKESKTKSSLRLKSKTPLQKDQIHKINTILMHLTYHPDSIDFRQPVDWRAFQLYDYLEVVKQPMDFSTINSKLKDKKYKTVQAVLNDIQLIWDNCKIYNSKQSIIYEIADKLQLSFRRMVRNYLPNLKVATVTSNPIAPITQPPFIVIYKPEREQNQVKAKQSVQQIPSKSKPKFQSKAIIKQQPLSQINQQPKPKLQSQIQNQIIPNIQQKPKTIASQLPKITATNIKKELYTKIYTLSQIALDKLITNIKQVSPKSLIQTQQGWAKLQLSNIQTPIITKLYNLYFQPQQINSKNQLQQN